MDLSCNTNLLFLAFMLFPSDELRGWGVGLAVHILLLVVALLTYAVEWTARSGSISFCYWDYRFSSLHVDRYLLRCRELPLDYFSCSNNGLFHVDNHQVSVNESPSLTVSFAQLPPEEECRRASSDESHGWSIVVKLETSTELNWEGGDCSASAIASTWSPARDPRGKQCKDSSVVRDPNLTFF